MKDLKIHIGYGPLISGVLLLLALSCMQPGVSATPAPWITTNTTGWHDGHTNELDYEMTPSLSANVPNSGAYYNKTARLFLQLREKVIVGARGSATYGGKVIASYDIRTAKPEDSSQLPRDELRAIWQTNQVLLRGDYYRGRVYYPGSAANSNEWMTVFSSVDNQRIVALRDSGPINYSENAGVSWTIISRPGEYEFELSSTPAGSKVVAVLTLSDLGRFGTGEVVQKRARQYWYSVASAADGSKLVLTGGAAESAPVLSITREGNNMVLSWPAESGSYTLQQTINFAAGKWENITNPVNVIGRENQARLPASNGSYFRLKKQ